MQWTVLLQIPDAALHNVYKKKMCSGGMIVSKTVKVILYMCSSCFFLVFSIPPNRSIIKDQYLRTPGTFF